MRYILIFLFTLILLDAKEDSEYFYKDYINKIEDKETSFNLEQKITGNFGLYPYKKNYLLPVTYDHNKDEYRDQLETIFQFSIKKPITYNFFGLNESFHLDIHKNHFGKQLLILHHLEKQTICQKYFYNFHTIRINY